MMKPGGASPRRPSRIGRVAIEVEQERRDLLVESVKIERVGGGDDARDLLGGGLK